MAAAVPIEVVCDLHHCPFATVARIEIVCYPHHYWMKSGCDGTSRD